MIAFLVAIEAALCGLILIAAPLVVLIALIGGDSSTAWQFGAGWVVALALLFGHLRYWGERGG